MKIKISKNKWEEIGFKTGWIKTSKIGRDDVSLILDKVQEIFVIMDRLQGVYKFLPEKKHLTEFLMGMKRVLPYAEAKSKKTVKH